MRLHVRERSGRRTVGAGHRAKCRASDLSPSKRLLQEAPVGASNRIVGHRMLEAPDENRVEANRDHVVACDGGLWAGRC